MVGTFATKMNITRSLFSRAVIALAMCLCVLWTQPASVAGLFEEQAGEFDWTLENIGKITHSIFQVNMHGINNL